MPHMRGLYLNIQTGYDAETRTKNRGPEDHKNWICEKGTLVRFDQPGNRTQIFRADSGMLNLYTNRLVQCHQHFVQCQCYTTAAKRCEYKNWRFTA